MTDITLLWVFGFIPLSLVSNLSFRLRVRVNFIPKDQQTASHIHIVIIVLLDIFLELPYVLRKVLVVCLTFIRVRDFFELIYILWIFVVNAV